MSDLAHIREIDRIVSGRATDSMRDAVVIDSWRRCIETYGMDPTKPEPAHIVTDAELREHREQAERLIAIARSGLQALFRQVAGQNYVLLLADAKGVTVDFFGDPRFESELRSAGLYLGADWSEDLAGTCGVGSCLVTGEAVTIHQTDHFGLAHTPLSCTAAPIYDTCGTLTAVLDISLLRSPAPKASQNLAMNLVCASARRVEMANLMAMTRRDWVLRFAASPEFLEVDPEAAVALDGAGQIIGLTRGAARLLGPAAPDGSLIGQRIEDLTDIAVDDLPDMMRGRPAEERVLRLRDGRGLFGHAIAPQAARLRAARAADVLPAALGSFAGPDPALAEILRTAAHLAGLSTPLLIAGETGTGKERLARAIHVSGERGRPLLTLRCAGAEAAHLRNLENGEDAPVTLVLDGVDDLDAAAQAALLGLLDLRPRLRAIATARADLAALTREGRFRKDLFFRLAGAILPIPPLRARHDFDWLLDRLVRQRGGEPRQFNPAAREELAGREWPGNIRELAAVLDVTLARVPAGGFIDRADLPPAALSASTSSGEGHDLETILEACEWNMALTARRLGVNRSTVLRRMRRKGLSRPA